MNAGLDGRYYRLALARARDKDLSGAVRYTRVSLSLNGENEMARKLLGICLYELGETDLAFRTLYSTPNWPDEARDELTLANTYLERLRACVSHNNRRKAISAAKAVPRQSVRVLNIQGCLYADAGRYGTAARFFALALEKDSGNTLAAAGLAEAVKRWKRFWRGL